MNPFIKDWKRKAFHLITYIVIACIVYFGLWAALIYVLWSLLWQLGALAAIGCVFVTIVIILGLRK